MAKIWGQLENAQLENKTSDYAAAPAGRVWWNTNDLQAKVDDGTNVRALLRNDSKAVIGNSGTAANNIRLHRGANGVLQLVTGSDATAEGSLSANLNQLSAKLETYTFATRPANGNAGRLIYVSDRNAVQVDNGTSWVGLGGGSGGGSIQWVESANSPIASIVSDNQVYLFESGLSQSLYALFRVPSTYIAGTQINLRIVFYSPDNSGTALVQSVATLIRTGTDAITSTTNQRTSGNAAVTLGAGTVNIPQSVVCDLTSSTGQINSVSVSGGDLIKIQLLRGTDTATSDVVVPVYGAEIA